MVKAELQRLTPRKANHERPDASVKREPINVPLLKPLLRAVLEPFRFKQIFTDGKLVAPVHVLQNLDVYCEHNDAIAHFPHIVLAGGVAGTLSFRGFSLFWLADLRDHAELRRKHREVRVELPINENSK